MLAYIYHTWILWVREPSALFGRNRHHDIRRNFTDTSFPCGKCWRCWRVLVKWIQMCEQSVWFPLGPLKCWMKRVVEIYHGYMDGILLETSHNLDGWNIPWMDGIYHGWSKNLLEMFFPLRGDHLRCSRITPRMEAASFQTLFQWCSWCVI